MAKRAIIGKVSVKVMPDTSDFADDLKRKLKAIEDKYKVVVSARVDENSLKRSALEAARNVSREIADRDAYKVKFGARIDTNTIRGDLGRVRDFVEEHNKKHPLNLRVGIEGTISRENARALRKEIEEKLGKVEINLHGNLDPVTKKIIQTELAILSRTRSAKIKPEIDKVAAAKVATALAALSGTRMVKNLFDPWKEWLKNLDKTAPLLGAVALGLTSVIGYSLSAASNLFALSSSLAQIGPAALALPGIFGGMAIGLGATIAVLKDFNTELPNVGQSFKDMQDSMSAEFWDVAREPIRDLIDNLLPSLTEGFTAVSGQLGGFFGSLATALRGAFDGPIDGMFADLAASIDIATTGTGVWANTLRILGAYGAAELPKLAQWFVDISTQFDNFLSGAEADGRLQGWIDNAKFQLGELGRVMGGLGGILSGLARAATAAGGSTLTMLADSLDRIHAVVDSPAFQTTLIGVLEAAHRMMTAIADGAGPAMVTLFTTLSDTFIKVADIAGPAIGSLLASLATALSSMSLNTGVVMLFEGIATAIGALAPMWGPLADMLGSIAGLLGTMVAAFAPVVTALVQAVAPAISAIAGALGPVVEVLAGALTEAILILTPLIQPLVDAFLALAAPLISAFAPLLPAVATALVAIATAVVPLVEALLPLVPVVALIAENIASIVVAAGELIAEVLVALTPLLPPIVQMISDWLTAILPLTPAIVDLVRECIPFVTAIIDAIVAEMPAIIDLFNDFTAEVIPLIPEVIDLVREMMPLVRELLPFFMAALPVVIEAFKFLFGPISDLARDALPAFTEAMRLAKVGAERIRDVIQDVSKKLSTMKEDWETACDRATAAVEGLREKVQGALKDPAGWLKASGKAVIDGFVQGFKDNVESAKRRISEGLSVLRGLFPNSPAKEGPFSGSGWVDRSGMAVADDFAKGIEARADKARKAAEKMAEQTKAALSGTEIVGPQIDNRKFIYNAAPGSSLGAEEDLFAAVGRGRFGGF